VRESETAMKWHQGEGNKEQISESLRAASGTWDSNASMRVIMDNATQTHSGTARDLHSCSQEYGLLCKPTEYLLRTTRSIGQGAFRSPYQSKQAPHLPSLPQDTTGPAPSRPPPSRLSLPSPPPAREEWRCASTAASASLSTCACSCSCSLSAAHFVSSLCHRCSSRSHLQLKMGTWGMGWGERGWPLDSRTDECAWGSGSHRGGGGAGMAPCLVQSFLHIGDASCPMWSRHKATPYVLP